MFERLGKHYAVLHLQMREIMVELHIWIMCEILFSVNVFVHVGVIKLQMA